MCTCDFAVGDSRFTVSMAAAAAVQASSFDLWKSVIRHSLTHSVVTHCCPRSSVKGRNDWSVEGASAEKSRELGLEADQHHAVCCAPNSSPERLLGMTCMHTFRQRGCSAVAQRQRQAAAADQSGSLFSLLKSAEIGQAPASMARRIFDRASITTLCCCRPNS